MQKPRIKSLGDNTIDETINVSPDSPISAAQFNIVQYADSVTMNGLEMLQNAGKEQIIDLLEGRMMVSEARLLNRIAGDIYLDGKTYQRAVH